MTFTWTWKRFLDLSGTEIHEILAVRQQVFILEQRCFYQDADEFDPCSWHLIGRNEAEAIAAYARLCFPNTKYAQPSIGRVLVVKSARNHGLGQQIMRHCLAKCADDYPNQGIRISAQQYLQQFYEQFGFTPCSQPYDDAGIPHIAMNRQT